jgi:hypothetical protein
MTRRPIQRPRRQKKKTRTVLAWLLLLDTSTTVEGALSQDAADPAHPANSFAVRTLELSDFALSVYLDIINSSPWPFSIWILLTHHLDFFFLFDCNHIPWPVFYVQLSMVVIAK